MKQNTMTTTEGKNREIIRLTEVSWWLVKIYTSHFLPILNFKYSNSKWNTFLVRLFIRTVKVSNICNCKQCPLINIFYAVETLKCYFVWLFFYSVSVNHWFIHQYKLSVLQFCEWWSDKKRRKLYSYSIFFLSLCFLFASKLKNGLLLVY